MKLRHLAGLTLVVWYLMLPPQRLDGIDTLARRSQWIRFQDYDTMADCISAKNQLNSRAEKGSVEAPLEFTTRQLHQYAAADCVPSSDPGLESK
jgi:hypothetical protein